MKKINYDTLLMNGDIVKLIHQKKREKPNFELFYECYLRVKNYDNKNSLSGVGTLMGINCDKYIEWKDKVIAYYKSGFLLLGGYDNKDYNLSNLLDLYKLNKYEIKILQNNKEKINMLNKLEQ
jgi:hypothetical protein